MKAFGKICTILALAASLIALSSCKKGGATSGLANTRWAASTEFHTASLTHTAVSGDDKAPDMTPERANTTYPRMATVNGDKLTYSGDVYTRK